MYLTSFLFSPPMAALPASLAHSNRKVSFNVLTHVKWRKNFCHIHLNSLVFKQSKNHASAMCVRVYNLAIICQSLLLRPCCAAADRLAQSTAWFLSTSYECLTSREIFGKEQNDRLKWNFYRVLLNWLAIEIHKVELN